MLDDTREHLAPLRPTDGINAGLGQLRSSVGATHGPAASDAAQAPPVREPFSDLRWYVIRHECFRGRESRDRIRDAGFQAYWPRRVVQRPRKDDLIEPLWHGYLLVQFSIARAGWSAISKLKPEVVEIMGVREWGAPVAVRPGFVEAMIAETGGIDLPFNLRGEQPRKRAEPHEVGAEVTLTGDAMADIRAIVHQDDGGARLKLMLALLGAERIVEIARSKVRAA